MQRIHSFPPLDHGDAHTLILGSMPGAASLAAGQYYAHPHNQFWPIMGELLGFAPSLPYAERCNHLHAAGIAVWDVLHSCLRQGSLDAAIETNSEAANDFATFFTNHPQLQRVCFNGAKAEAAFTRHVKRQLIQPGQLEYIRLPSTSPAHAGMRPAEKLLLWRAALSRR